MTGPTADVGLSMERAAALSQPLDERASGFMTVDTGGTAEGARAAAARAVLDGAGLILGPLFAREVPAVVAGAEGRPVVTFSNDGDLIGSGAFVLGLTASQGVSAILAYARGQGVRRVTAIRGTDPWSAQSIAAARDTAARLGLELFTLEQTRTAGDGDVGPALAAASGGRLPDAVLFSQGGGEISDLVARVSRSGVQLLGPSRWSEETPAFLTTAEGAWIAAPDPAAFGGFAEAFEARHRAPPGLLAGLAFDGATMARRMRTAGRVTRAGLVTGEGFQGALGAVRFTADGRCTRQLAIQVAGRGALRVVDHLPGA